MARLHHRIKPVVVVESSVAFLAAIKSPSPLEEAARSFRSALVPSVHDTNRISLSVKQTGVEFSTGKHVATVTVHVVAHPAVCPSHESFTITIAVDPFTEQDVLFFFILAKMPVEPADDIAPFRHPATTESSLALVVVTPSSDDKTARTRNPEDRQSVKSYLGAVVQFNNCVKSGQLGQGESPAVRTRSRK